MSVKLRPRFCGAVLVFLVVFIIGAASNQSRGEGCHKLRINGARDWRPFSWRTDEPETLSGLFPDMIRTVLKETPIAIEYGPEMPWNRLFAVLENDGMDLLAGAFLTEDRKTKFTLSAPIAEEDVAVFMRTGMTAKPEDFTQLKGLSGRAPFGVSLSEEKNRFAAEHLSIDSEPIDDIAMDLKMLADGRIDYILMSRRFGLKAVAAAGLETKIEDLPWPAAVKPIHFMFAKASPCTALLPRLNAAIEEYRRSGISK